ncbi:hypothetical protein GCM10027436_45990 [Actinophytocola sediminis]
MVGEHEIDRLAAGRRLRDHRHALGRGQHRPPRALLPIGRAVPDSREPGRVPAGRQVDQPIHTPRMDITLAAE